MSLFSFSQKNALQEKSLLCQMNSDRLQNMMDLPFTNVHPGKLL